MKCLIFFNPKYGTTVDSYNLALRERVLEEDKTSTIHIVNSFPQLFTEMSRFEIDCIAFHGGDGTFHYLSKYLIQEGKTHIPLIPIPHGTCVDYQRNFNIPDGTVLRNWLSELDFTRKTPRDVFSLNDDIFLNIAGYGYLMNVGYDANEQIKRIFNKHKKLRNIAYYLEVLKATLKKPESNNIGMLLDNQYYEMENVIATMFCNTNYIGGYSCFPDYDFQDKKSEIMIIHNATKKQISQEFHSVLKHEKLLSEMSFVECFTASEIDVVYDSEYQQPFDLDGEKGVSLKRVHVESKEQINLILPN